MTITLEDLRPAEGATHKSKRVGRGRSSGHGKTSCRGNNGEGQRSGNSAKRGFEGGQMPGYRQMPKLKGFKLINQLKYAEIIKRRYYSKSLLCNTISKRKNRKSRRKG